MHHICYTGEYSVVHNITIISPNIYDQYTSHGHTHIYIHSHIFIYIYTYIHTLSSIIYIMEQTTVWYKHEIPFLKGKIIECALYTDNIKELWTFALINKRCSVKAKQRLMKKWLIKQQAVKSLMNKKK